MARDTNLYMFLTGLGIGALGAILLAPAAGSETRGMVLNAANDASDRIKDGIAKGNELVDQGLAKSNDLLARGSEFVGGLQNKVNDAVGASKKAMDNVVTQSKDLAHSTGEELESAGQRLQSV